jgi:RNAse (barnase) inhibitor barstar
MNEVVIDLEDCKNRNEVFNKFAKVFKFPKWWGKNWDAFYDCLKDKDFNNLNEDYYMVIINYEEYKRTQKDEFKIMAKILDDSKKFGVKYILK